MSEEQPVVAILNAAPAILLQPNVTGIWVEPNGTTHVDGARFTK